MAQYKIPMWLADPRGNKYPPGFNGNIPATTDPTIAYLGPASLRGGRYFVKQGVDGETGHLSLSLGIDEADVELLVKGKFSPVTPSSTFNNTGPIGLFARASFSGTLATGRPSTSYYFINNGGAFPQRNVALYKQTSSQTSLGAANNAISDPGANTRFTAPDVLARFQCIGTTVRGRMWLETETEPSTWAISVTDADLTTGDAGVIISGYGAQSALKWLSVGTAGDPAPMAADRTVAGVLLKPDGDPADGYLVRCFARETGALLGETLANSAGSFAFTLDGFDRPVTVLGVDQLGNTWNCPVKDLINPGV